MSAENKHSHIFNVDGKHLRGFLDVKSKEIVIFDDYNGKELFRIGNNGSPAAGGESQEQYERAIISLEIKNATNSRQTAILFSANREPLIQPLGITVIVKEIQSTIFDSHNYLRRDILTSPIKLSGMRYYVSNAAQFDNVIQFGHIPSYGRMKFYDFHPKDYLSLYQNPNQNFVEAPKFRGIVDANTQISVPVNPQTTCTLQFVAFFKKENGRSRKNIYTNSSAQGNSIDAYNSVSGDNESVNKGKSIFPKILLTAALLSFGAFIVYKINKIEGKLSMRLR